MQRASETNKSANGGGSSQRQGGDSSRKTISQQQKSNKLQNSIQKNISQKIKLKINQEQQNKDLQPPKKERPSIASTVLVSRKLSDVHEVEQSFQESSDSNTNRPDESVKQYFQN